MEKNLKIYFAENGLLVRDGDGGVNARVQLYPSNGAVRAVGELVWKSVLEAVKTAITSETTLSDTDIYTKAEGVDVQVTLTPFGVVTEDAGTGEGGGSDEGTDTPTTDGTDGNTGDTGDTDTESSGELDDTLT